MGNETVCTYSKLNSLSTKAQYYPISCDYIIYSFKDFLDWSTISMKPRKTSGSVSVPISVLLLLVLWCHSINSSNVLVLRLFRNSQCNNWRENWKFSVLLCTYCILQTTCQINDSAVIILSNLGEWNLKLLK